MFRFQKNKSLQSYITFRRDYHMHPIPVTCYIISGAWLFQVEGEQSKTLHAGDVDYHLVNHPIKNFDNLPCEQPLKFISYYLTDKDERLIIKLPLKHKI